MKDEKADKLPILSGPWDSLEDAERSAHKYADAGTNVAIDYRPAAYGRRAGYFILDNDNEREQL